MTNAKRILLVVLLISLLVFAIATGILLCGITSALLGIPSVVIALSALAGFIFYSLFANALGWILQRLSSEGVYREVSGKMNHEQLSELLNNMNGLQVDSFEARQALIRESFAARYQPSDFQPGSETSATIDVEPTATN